VITHDDLIARASSTLILQSQSPSAAHNALGKINLTHDVGLIHGDFDHFHCLAIQLHFQAARFITTQRELGSSEQSL
jgi:hypothetical protein